VAIVALLRPADDRYDCYSAMIVPSPNVVNRCHKQAKINNMRNRYAAGDVFSPVRFIAQAADVKTVDSSISRQQTKQTADVSMDPERGLRQ
jgi:hypothetical protein